MCIRDRASSYGQDQNTPELLKYNYEAHKIFEETGNKQGLAMSYITLSSSSLQEGNYKDAKKYALKASRAWVTKMIKL